MILSEFAGAAQSLNGSIIVNPWNTEELAQAIDDALTMSDEQRAINHVKLYKYVTRYTSQYWGITHQLLKCMGLIVGKTFVTELRRIAEQAVGETKEGS
jgi:trehalose 6-phosphate synthase